MVLLSLKSKVLTKWQILFKNDATVVKKFIYHVTDHVCRIPSLISANSVFYALKLGVSYLACTYIQISAM